MIGSHIVPKYYLEQFAVKKKKSAKTGHLWVYSTDAPPRLGTARNEGRENGYFGFPLDNGSLDERLEGELQRIEDRATDVLACAGSELFVWSVRARQILASYCGHLYARVRARREAASWLGEKMWKEFRELLDDEDFMRLMAARYNMLPAQARQQMSDLADKACTPAERKRTFLAEIPLKAQWMTDVLLAKQWRVWTSVETAEFITSDNPLVSALPINEKFAPGFGFARSDVVVFFPLNPQSCLVMGGAAASSRRVALATVEEVNRCLVYSMTRDAYSRTKSLRIANDVQKFGGKLRFGENAFVLTVPQPSVREFLKAHLSLGGGRKGDLLD